MSQKKNISKKIFVVIAILLTAALAVFVIFALFKASHNSSFGIVQINGQYVFPNNKIYDSETTQTEKYYKEYIGNNDALLMATKVSIEDFSAASIYSLYYICEQGQKQLSDSVVAFCSSGNGNIVCYAENVSDELLRINVYNIKSDEVTFLGELKISGIHNSIDIMTDYTGRLVCISAYGKYLYYNNNERIIDSNDIQYRPLALSYNDNYFLTFDGTYIWKYNISEGSFDRLTDVCSRAEFRNEYAESTEFDINIDGTEYYYSLKDCENGPIEIGRGRVIPAVYESSDSMKNGVFFCESDGIYYTVEALINRETYSESAPLCNSNIDGIFSSTDGKLITLTEGNLYAYSTQTVPYKYEKGFEKLKRFFWDSNAMRSDKEMSDSKKLNQKLVLEDKAVLSDKDNCLYYIAYNNELWKCGFKGNNTQIAYDVRDIELSSTGILYYSLGPDDSDQRTIYSYSGNKSQKVTDNGIFDLGSSNGRVYYIDKTNAEDMTSDYGDHVGSKYYIEDGAGLFSHIYTTQY